ncbi:hypothetical protein [Amycolatopsis sp. NPDC051102]|uniref:hypothetical protein n=1 Tax=Amycolatopsis sp. NPDC051102 TaxID=3155163 RepID=UPI00343E7ADD
MIGLTELYAAAGVDPDEPVRRLARALGEPLAPLVFSAAAAEGHPIGARTALVLERQRVRARRYAEALALVRAVANPTVLKGPALARRYPAHLQRPVGDLDLVVSSEEQLWAAARRLIDGYDAVPSVFTLIRHDGTDHCLIGLDWPSDDPLSESDFEVEISTFAYAGDQAAIPMRPGFPSSEPLTQLFAVAEERCQGPFSVKHVLDCAVLLAAEPDLLAGPAAEEAVTAFRVAPELLELVTLATALSGGRVPGRLPALAEAERARRRCAGPSADPALAGGRWSSADNVRFGLLLDRFARPGTTWHPGGPTPGGELVHTPVGDYLMLTGARVDAADVDHARRLSKSLRTATPVPGA